MKAADLASALTGRGLVAPCASVTERGAAPSALAPAKRGRDAAAFLERLRSEIAALEALDIDLLRRRWRSVMGRPAPAPLPRGLIFRVLAWRLQVDALDAVETARRPKQARRALRRASPGADSLAGVSHRAGLTSSLAPELSTSSLCPKASNATISIRPGTVFVREYGGALHRVTATGQGFSWNDRIYSSLSEVALAITGTKWNGPRFFGLRPSRPSGGAP